MPSSLRWSVDSPDLARGRSPAGKCTMILYKALAHSLCQSKLAWERNSICQTNVDVSRLGENINSSEQVEEFDVGLNRGPYLKRDLGRRLLRPTPLRMERVVVMRTQGLVKK
ncbi:hypothetical protein J6590_073434 [Homalodisca vitripennis]|nr:hypothetical protein J6590_073434 [Homalodisca vitripennis]